MVKKLLCAALCAVTMLSPLGAWGYDEPTVPKIESLAEVYSQEQKVGDVDHDGKVSAKDARLILRHSAKLQILSVSMDIIDINGNGRVTAADARIVLRRSAKLSDVAPPTTRAPATTEAPTTAAPKVTYPVTIGYPTNTKDWELILLNKNFRLGNVDSKLALKYVANSSEMLDYRAAAAYTKLYGAAARVGLYLTPCSGYRSYDSQVALFNEFVYDYMNAGYSQKDAYELASRRRMPAGSSEHNIGICMDIICASSAYGFENTAEYRWLMANAQDYGFILRYPANKTEITGVKFEPWHWRYVGAANAKKIKASGLCLEEYLGMVV